MQLGFYTGQPNGNDATAMAAWKAKQAAAQKLMGTAPSVIGVSEQALGQNAGTMFYSVLQAGANGLTVLDEVPLGSSAAQNQQIVAGAYDTYYAGIVAAALFYGIKTLQVRIAPEMNLPGGKAWGVARAADAPLFIAAWQHVATIMRTKAKAIGVTLGTNWNPLAISSNPVSPKALYPGDAYVDNIGLDIYSPIALPGSYYPWNTDLLTVASWTDCGAAAWVANVNNLKHAWRYQSGNYWNATGCGNPVNWSATSQGWGLIEHIQFAQAHGKPISICETGCGPKAGMIGLANNADFFPFLASVLAGVNCSFVNIWMDDESDGSWGILNGEQPATAASAAQAFGVQAVTAAVKATPVLTLTLSEDPASDGKTTDAQCVVTLDGVATTYTITASHAAGATQTVTLPVSAGAHSVTVAFTNDYCAWVNGAYASGVAGKDRNLYLLSASVNGVAIPNAAHTFNSNGSLTLAFSV